MNAQWEQRAKDWKLIGEALQPFFLTLSAIGAAGTFLVSEIHKSEDRTKEALDRAEARSLPFYQKQLDIFAEAARVSARLATTPETDPNYPAAIGRFWELYWGDLSMVETPAVEAMMVSICRTYVSAKNPSRCKTGDTPGQVLAIELAHLVAKEIKDRWVDGKRTTPVP